MALVGPPRPGRHVLVWLTVALVPAFTITACVAHAFREKHHALAREWEAHGNAVLQQSRATEAVAAFRTSLTYDRENRAVRLRLAQALIADGRPNEASAHLMTLWDAQPGNGPVNLELGRLARQAGDVRMALRYYHNAVEGSWPDAAEDRRRTARLELAQFLVEKEAIDEAQAELIHLASDMPANSAARLQIAGLFVLARLPQRALAIYRDVLRDDPTHPGAAAGAGHVALALEDDAAAERYLAAAVRHGAPDPELSATLDMVREIRAVDPFPRRLGVRSRAARATRAVDRAIERLRGCPGDRADVAQTLQQLTAARPAVALRRLASEPEALDTTMDLVFAAERLASTGCGEATPLDRALLTLAERRGAAAS
jgi:tetratricopeptide (TPR) repeat protein